MKCKHESVAYILEMFGTREVDKQQVASFKQHVLKIYPDLQKNQLTPSIQVGEPSTKHVSLAKDFVQFHKICPLVTERISLTNEYEQVEYEIPKATIHKNPFQELTCSYNIKIPEIKFIRDAVDERIPVYVIQAAK